MISVSDNQLRIVAEAADLLPAEARGTFLRRVVAEVREGRSFKDSDIERAVRVALLDQSMKRVSVSSTDQGGGKRRSDTPSVSQEALASFAAFLRRIAGLVRLRGFPRSFNFFIGVNSRCSGGILNWASAMGASGRSTSLVSAKSWRALNTCGNQLRFKWRATYWARWNMHRCCTSPSATHCASSSEIERASNPFAPVARRRNSRRRRKLSPCPTKL